MRDVGAAAAILVAIVLLGGPLAAAAGGGSVSNTLPTVASFAHAGAAEQELGSTDVFTATVQDRNGEDDIVRLKLATTSGPSVVLEHDVTASERSATTEPVAFTGGWKVWDPTPSDGALLARVQVTFVNAGSHVFAFSVKDEAAYQTGPAGTLGITVTSSITVLPDPVGLDGAAQAGNRWGAWTADPGATNVLASNYIRIDNGATSTQSFTLDFTETVFRGTSVTTKTIPIDGNIQFAWWEDTTPATASPADGTFAFDVTSTDGSVTPQFTGAGNTIYIRYRIVALAETLLDQTYEASLTVTAA